MSKNRIIRMTAEDLACLACGQRVAPPHTQPQEFDAWAQDDPRLGVRDIQRRTTTLTRCATCLETHEHASLLLEEHPRVQTDIGGHSVAMHRVESALNALDALGRMLTIRTDKDLRQLIEHLTAPGVAARWSRRFAPVLSGASGTCAASPWAHVSNAQRQALRDGFAALLQARVERPIPHMPPTGFGCMMCGVGSVSALPSRSNDAWSPRIVSAASIGGLMGGETIEGYLCPVCDEAAYEAGAVGPTAMERSVLQHLGVRRVLSPIELVGVVGWAAMVGAAPNESAWAHIPNLCALAEELS